LDALGAVNSEVASELTEEIIRDSKNKVLVTALKSKIEKI
jgi:hypothetical protein